MALVKHVPVKDLRKAVFKLIKDNQTGTVYGPVPKSALLPYITVGSCTFKPIGAKNTVIWDTSVQIHAWAGPDDMAAVNEIVDDVVTILTGFAPGSIIDVYKVIDVNIDLVETFNEINTGYHGIVTAKLTLSDYAKGGN